MTALLYIAVYASVLCFTAGCLRLARHYASLPVHLRWELYPVPHEPASRAEHGGSYFEESDWWTKPREFNLAGELRAMSCEILLLKSVWESNRKLWWKSMLFHSGLYCIVMATAAQIFLAVTSLLWAASWLTQVTVAAGWLGTIGLGLVMLGTAALLAQRIFDRELSDYTHPADYVHLGVIGGAATLLLVGSLSSGSPSAVALFRGALTFNTGVHVPVLIAAGSVLTLALLAYVPFSRMAHFIAKYFAYHAVRWDDVPNRGTAMEQQILTNLALRPTWSADHICNRDGRRTWAEIAAENPAVLHEVHK